MFLNIILLVVGTTLVLWGADRFTDGACAIARKWGVSELLIGLTVVAMGTSLPEFVVSFFSALSGSGDMSAGNIVGSNIFNTLIIVGASALTLPVLVEREMLVRQMPICLVASVALVTFGLTSNITRIDALLLCVLFVFFMVTSVRMGMQQKADSTDKVADVSMWKTIGLLIVGITALVGGGQMLVHSAADIARQLGVSEAVIGLTILAGGTSLPELATSVVAARKGMAGLSLGNAVGSNIFNICFVLGICGLIRPLQVSGLTLIDWLAMLGSLLLLWLFSFTGRRIGRVEGALLVLAYATYLGWLLW